VKEIVDGDVNADGVFNMADLVMLQKWIVCTEDAALTLWKAGDMYRDGKITASDLTIMKYVLLMQR